MSDALRSGYGKEFENIVKTMNKYSEIGKKAKVTLKDFNDKENNLKKYTVGKKFKAEDKRYKELEAKGFVGEGKEVTAKSDK